MATETIQLNNYRDATYVDCAITYNTTATITDVTLASGTLVTVSGATDFVDGTEVYCYGVEGTYSLNNRDFTLASGTTVSGLKTFLLLDSNGNEVDSTGYNTYTGGGTLARYATTISGLEHLEGNEVKVVSEGAVHPDCTVSGGAITLQYRVKHAIIGLGFDSHLTTMPIEVGNEMGAAIGRKKKIADVWVRLHESLGVKVGPDTATLDAINFRSSDDDMDAALPLFTGDKNILFPKGFDTYQTVTVASEDPLPLTILAIVPTLNTSTK